MLIVWLKISYKLATLSHYRLLYFASSHLAYTNQSTQSKQDLDFRSYFD
ncbi:hypothetical protein KDE13_04920 [Campylobacter sp. faydin G-140]|nr:hypothetical protein [Campylobacter anatolicus]